MGIEIERKAVLAAVLAMGAQAQESGVQANLATSLNELSQVRASISEKKLPLVKKLNELEDAVLDLRLEHRKVMHQLDSRNLELNNLHSEAKAREDEKNYISNLLDECTRNFQTHLHIAELARYQDAVDEAVLAPENPNLSEQESLARQVALVAAAVGRLQDAVGGTSFPGTAVGKDGLVKQGEFLLAGPVALFSAKDGSLAGLAVQRLGSTEPTVMPFAEVGNARLVRDVVAAKGGIFPFDPSLGNAFKIEETHETLGEHLRKGGFVVYPIAGMFILVVIVSVLKWVQLARIPMPSDGDMKPLLHAMLHNDHDQARKEVAAIKGPTANMLEMGIEHIAEPHDLVEEVMYEELLMTRLRVGKYTSSIAVCASSAPLLGLLGTVTGIINTFKLITVFGSGDAKALSGGISEALITTELGLIVAIFSLILHAFLSHKAKKVTGRMEQVAILFMNRTARSAPRPAGE